MNDGNTPPSRREGGVFPTPKPLYKAISYVSPEKQKRELPKPYGGAAIRSKTLDMTPRDAAIASGIIKPAASKEEDYDRFHGGYPKGFVPGTFLCLGRRNSKSGASA